MFGRLKGKRKTVFQKGISNKKQIDSLGKIPSTIRYIDSLTVFNTHINPYRKYEVLDRPVIDQQQQRRKRRKVVPVDNDDAVNYTITTYVKEQLDVDINRYRPEEKQFDEMQFDQDLGLQGIVGIHQAFNDDVTNFAQAKKKTVVKDSLAGKKGTNQSSIISA